ncbi:MAG: acetolactate synthase small subunit, partial [Oscillospiraceae bacterium]|nr:acetolactate synthase small subunit [Oscillospiraceae bacterium]
MNTMSKEKRYVLSALVENRPGVLSRVTGLFTRRAYNIDSLTVAETENPARSRMTIALHSDEHTAVQIKHQLEKLIDVIEVRDLEPGLSVTREHVLIKVAAPGEARMSVISLASIFRANIVDVSPDNLIIELTGDSTKTEAFIEIIRPFGILQAVRSGLSGLERG